MLFIHDDLVVFTKKVEMERAPLTRLGLHPTIKWQYPWANILFLKSFWPEFQHAWISILQQNICNIQGVITIFHIPISGYHSYLFHIITGGWFRSGGRCVIRVIMVNYKQKRKFFQVVTFILFCFEFFNCEWETKILKRC